MKKLIHLSIALISTITFAQVDVKVGIPLEYNETKDVTFRIFKPALRINKIENPSKIDYSKIEGLIQSYFSATDSIWDKSDYLDKTHNSVKDDEHYNSVKKSNSEKEYVEIESIYEFTHNNQKRNYVKYAITIDGLPFQVVAVLSCVEVNKRWYIENIFNQSNILFLLSRLNSEKLKILFQSEKTSNEIISEIKRKCTTDGLIDINILYDFYQMESKNRESIYIKEIRDERNWTENYHYPRADLNALAVKESYKITMPFSLDNAVFSVYDKNESLLTNNPKIFEKMKDRVEKLLIPTSSESVKLIHKLKFSYNNLDYSLIKYERNNKLYIENFINNKEKIDKKTIPEAFSNLIFRLKSNTFLELLSGKFNSKELEKIHLLAISNSEKMMNITLLNKIIEKNKTTLAKYLDQ